jgi:hypothetical protein
MVEQDFVNEKKSAAREFEDQKIYLRDHLISELEEKQKQVVVFFFFRGPPPMAGGKVGPL